MQKLIEPLFASKVSSLSTTSSAQSPECNQQGILTTPSLEELNSISGGVANVKTVPDSPDKSQEAGNASSTRANWSPSLQTMLEQPPSSLPHQLLLGGLVFCMAFGTWATFGQIDEVGHAQGRLVPKGEVYKIHPIDSGKIASIQVKEGQAVKAGQTLIELDTEIAGVEVERLEQLLSADKIQLSQMQALIERTKDEGKIQSEIAIADTQAQVAAIAQAQAKAEAQKIAITQAQGNTATYQKLLTQLHNDEAAYQTRMNRLKPLVEVGAIATEQLFEAEQSLRDRQRSITQSQGELQQASTESDRLQAELQQAERESDRLQAGLLQKQAEGRSTQLEAQQKVQQLEVEINQLKAKIAETYTLLTSAKAKLKQRFLYAPVDGTVSSLNIANVGEVIQPGQTLAEIAPQDVPLVLSASLPNQEAGLVKPGMPVQVKLEAYPYQDYGIVSGKVTSISSDTKPDERLGAVYKVEVSLAQRPFTSNHQDLKLKAGETATAEIIIRRRRIADFLLDPIRQLQKGGINL